MALLREAQALMAAKAPRRQSPPHPARQSLEAFIRHTRPDYDCQWYHALWCRTLDRFVAGDIPRLMVFAPPRHGKSELVSRRLPAYLLGRFPDAQVIACSYSAGLASSMNRDVQRIIVDPRYGELFPDTTLSAGGHAQGRWKRTDDFFEVVGKKGSYRSAGVGGGITGMGFDFGLIDDPIKNQEEALSPTMREKVWEWYTSTFLTRQAKDARILVTLTRWHADDLAGRLLQLARDDALADHWHVLRFPALAEDPPGEGDQRQPGEALWPGRFGAPFLGQMRASLGSYQFASLYDQKPIPMGGGLYKGEWFARRYLSLEDGWRLENGKVWPRHFCYVFTVLDPATGKNHLSDHTAIGTFAVTPDKDVLVLDVVRERIRIEDLAGRLATVVTRWGSAYVLVEASGFQVTVVKEARKALKVPVREVLPEGKSKLVRAIPSIAKAEAGEILLPKAALPWVAAYLEELTGWTAQDGDHDDQVDVTAYAIMDVTGKCKGIELMDVPARPAHERRGHGFGR